MEELRNLPWEFALVARLDLGERGGETDGLPRALVIWAPTTGLQEFHIEPAPSGGHISERVNV